MARKCGTASNREMQMTSDPCRLVHPGSVAQWSTAKRPQTMIAKLFETTMILPQDESTLIEQWVGSSELRLRKA
jgi:hypothetical protein